MEVNRQTASFLMQRFEEAGLQPERRRGQTFLVRQIRAEPDRARRRYTVRAHNDGLAIDLGSRRHEVSILTGDRKV